MTGLSDLLDCKIFFVCSVVIKLVAALLLNMFRGGISSAPSRSGGGFIDDL
jgi:hypothetical protein